MEHKIEILWEGKMLRTSVNVGFELSEPFFVIKKSGRPTWWFKKVKGEWTQFATTNPLPAEQQLALTNALDELIRTTDIQDTKYY